MPPPLLLHSTPQIRQLMLKLYTCYGGACISPSSPLPSPPQIVILYPPPLPSLYRIFDTFDNLEESCSFCTQYYYVPHFCPPCRGGIVLLIYLLRIHPSSLLLAYALPVLHYIYIIYIFCSSELVWGIDSQFSVHIFQSNILIYYIISPPPSPNRDQASSCGLQYLWPPADRNEVELYQVL